MNHKFQWQGPVSMIFSFRSSIPKNITLSPPILQFSASAVYYKSHYDVLELTPSATQGDIKAAYYEKSMKYHPDKNKGSEEAARKFRDITEAYEVLGNLRLRKLYDKGAFHTAGPEFATEKHEMQHGEEKFYQSREQRSRVPSPTGSTKIYNFDAWIHEHYSKSFARREAAKARYEFLRNDIRDRSARRNEFLFFSGIMFIVAFSTLMLSNTSFDEPKVIQNVKSERVETSDNVQNNN